MNEPKFNINDNLLFYNQVSVLIIKINKEPLYDVLMERSDESRTLYKDISYDRFARYQDNTDFKIITSQISKYNYEYLVEYQNKSREWISEEWISEWRLIESIVKESIELEKNLFKRILSFF